MKARLSRVLGEILSDQRTKATFGDALRDAAKPESRRGAARRLVVKKGGKSYQVTLADANKR
jgi:hypothetical protein